MNRALEVNAAEQARRAAALAEVKHYAVHRGASRDPRPCVFWAYTWSIRLSAPPIPLIPVVLSSQTD